MVTRTKVHIRGETVNTTEVLSFKRVKQRKGLCIRQRKKPRGGWDKFNREREKEENGERQKGRKEWNNIIIGTIEKEGELDREKVIIYRERELKKMEREMVDIYIHHDNDEPSGGVP